MRYCIVASCKYYAGTNDPQARMFRIPNEYSRREKWMDVLSKHRITNGNLVCSNHFTQNDFKRSGKQISLNATAVPSIFEPEKESDEEEYVDTEYLVDNDENQNDDHCEASGANDDLIEPCNQCNCLQEQIETLVARCTELEKVMNRNDSISKQRTEAQSAEISGLKEANLVQSKKIALLEREINEKKIYIDQTMQSALGRFIAHASDPKDIMQKEILSCLASGIRKGESYPEPVRNFIIGLQNASPAGYRYVRQVFSDRIPAPSTIRAWYTNSDINCDPGIMKYSLDVLKRIVREMASDGKKFIAALLFDEMSIHKMLQFIKTEMMGFETIPGIEKKNAQVASQVLVFMISGVNYNIQLPIAYYFASSLQSVVKADIVKDVISSVIDCGVDLVGLTFDGFRTNPALCEILGADLNVLSDSFNPNFTINDQKINIVFDPSHVIKCSRNTLGSKDKIYDEEGGIIKWIFFENLVNFSKKRNFSAPIHKLSQSHIDYKSNDMNVKLAVETFSSSTANAIEYLKNAGYSNFSGSDATIKFIRMVNDAFDLSNSTHNSLSKENIFKRPWNPESIGQINEKRAEIVQYFKGLKIRSANGNIVPLCTSQNKTGFQGIISNMHSFNEIYNDYVVKGKLMDYLPVHTLSQDHLEQMFGDIRSFNGSNNNPNTVQFRAGLRKILANTTVVPSKKRNCTVLNTPVYNPFSNISTVTSCRPKSLLARNTNIDVTPDEIDQIFQELSEIKQNDNLIDLSELTMAHIASKIEIEIEKNTSCESCKNVFQENIHVHKAFHSSTNTRKACQSTYDICKAADGFLKLELLKGQFGPQLISEAILLSLSYGDLYENSCFANHTENNGNDDHKDILINKILRRYIQIKGQYIAKTVSIEQHNEQMRKKLSKLILHYNQ